jgi:hypothetical protein
MVRGPLGSGDALGHEIPHSKLEFPTWGKFGAYPRIDVVQPLHRPLVMAQSWRKRAARGLERGIKNQPEPHPRQRRQMNFLPAFENLSAPELDSPPPIASIERRDGCRSGLYVQPNTFHPLDPRMFAAHMWRPGFDKGPSRAFRMLERDLAKEGKAHHRIVEPPDDRKGKPKWSVPWERKHMAWFDLWSGRAVTGPTEWKKKDGKQGACWGLTKAELRSIADAVAVDRGLGQVVNGQPVELPFQVFPPGVTKYKLDKSVAKAEAQGSVEPFEDALTNLWTRKRRKRRPARRVRVEAWNDHVYGEHGDHMTVATERGLHEQTPISGVEYGRSRHKPERDLIHASYWPNGLKKWRWDRQRWIPADPDGASNWWQGDYLILRDVAKLSIREGAILKMRSLDPPLAVSGIARFFRIDPKTVRTSEQIGLKRLAEARGKVGELTPPPAVEHRLRPIAMVYAEWECGDLEMFWDRSRLAAPSFTTGSGDVRKNSLGCPYQRDEFSRGVWRWRPESYYPYSGDHIDPERFLRQDGGGYVQTSRPLLVPIATLLARER